MTLDQLSTAVETILPVVEAGQEAYFATFAEYEQHGVSHDSIPPISTIPDDDHYSVGAIAFRFSTNVVSKTDSSGWILEAEGTVGETHYRRNFTGNGPSIDTGWVALPAT